MSDDELERMSGEELAHILALEGHEAALQAAIDAAPGQGPESDFEAAAHALLTVLGADPAHPIQDDQGKKHPRVAILADELMRAALEEG
jgi:hypothetical protein